MERRDFFRKLGIGVAAVVAAPMLMAKAVIPKSKWTHVAITPAGNDIFDLYTGGYWDRSLTSDEVKMFYNILFEPAEIDHLLKLMPVRPVDFWINGKQVMKNGKVIR